MSNIHYNWNVKKKKKKKKIVARTGAEMMFSILMSSSVHSNFFASVKIVFCQEVLL